LASPEPDDVSTVSAADVIVDEAQPPSSFESQGDLSGALRILGLTFQV
jgi:hypothetical protein